MEYCFYLDWSGLEPEVWAAWAQAVLSAIAIVVAARMAINQEKRQQRAKLSAYLAIASDIVDQADSSLKDFRGREGQYSSLPQYQWWERICSVLDAIPLHEIPDYRLYDVIWRAKNISIGARELHAKTQSKELIDAKKIEIMELIRENAGGVYDETVKVVNEVITPSIVQRIRYWWLKRG
ncbi:hypothetical protein [Pseudoxanthomonas sp. PXM02]|uniref:hypothetical protein n=1 Tax=Pseudoxanthomonas sp. PXM02 TaxID=2769294 RepID=UPI001786C47D|nr:hypothetical protein [Pseudoxanthomonas sp. PXM02]MBD9481163.1 hypothetical protein [Pseudoxanthomonas sp. PXM02]